MHNAHYLFKHYGPQWKGRKTNIPITDFEEYTVNWLIGEINLPKYLQPVAQFHYLHPVPRTGKKKNPTRKCVNCTKNGKRRESRYLCAFSDGQPALCVYPCYLEHHMNIGVATGQVQC